MEYILRQSYLNEIQKFINKPVTKILIGMRRVGKSTILKMISEVLLKDIPSENKIFMNFESLELLGIRMQKLLPSIYSHSSNKIMTKNISSSMKSK